jgi:hypothetical protein
LPSSIAHEGEEPEDDIVGSSNKEEKAERLAGEVKLRVWEGKILFFSAFLFNKFSVAVFFPLLRC